jgi:hypothetical protein
MELSATDALRELRRSLASGCIDDIPDGWMTVRQWADTWGIQRPRAGEIIRNATQRGQMEKRMFRVDYDLFARETPHYRMADALRDSGVVRSTAKRSAPVKRSPRAKES